MAALKFSLIPMLAIMIGALIAGWRTPGEKLVAAMQHLAAGVVSPPLRQRSCRW